jgi:hypothetical protein
VVRLSFTAYPLCKVGALGVANITTDLRATIAGEN